ncbi:MAG: hypothetical protein HY307_01360 [Arcobacter sp.]|nr:hypothetical protein [Arcobacter sp.]
MKKQILITFAIFFILGFIISVALSYDKERRINMYLSDQLTMSNTQFDVTYKGYSTLSQSIYNSIISNKQIIKLMSDAGNTTSLVKQNEIRKELYDSLTSIYQDWGAMGIKQIHFHLKNNVSFLRMYAPSKFGDDLTSFRYSVKFVNQTQTPTDGLEMGKLGNGFRFVYPLIDSHSTHIGSVEISIPVEDFLQRIEDSFNAQVHFLVDKKYVDNIASISDIMDDVYSKTDISPQFYTLRSNKGDHVGSILPKTITKVMENKLLEKKPFYVYFKTNEGFYTIVTFLPIKNIEGN